MADLEKFNAALDQMVQLMMEMKRALKDETTPSQPPVQAQSTPVATVDTNSFDYLVQTLKSDKWPEAVNPNLICNPESEVDKQDRGRGIIELMIEEDLKDLKFLDIGCGEGHTASLSTEYFTSLSVGYDINRNKHWESFPQHQNLKFTTDFAEVDQLGPYNVILIFDVIDHIINESPITLLQRAKKVLAPNGKIYMRCHPFTSRHASHLYHALNKAYMHLVFTEEELKTIVPETPYREPSIKVITPLKTYHEIIGQAALRVISKRDVNEQVEPFFKAPFIANRIIKNTNFGSFPEFQMSMQFLDWVLSH